MRIAIEDGLGKQLNFGEVMERFKVSKVIISDYYFGKPSN